MKELKINGWIYNIMIRFYLWRLVLYFIEKQNVCPVCSRWKRTTRVRFLYTGVLETFNGIVSLVEFTFERLLFARIYDYRRVNRGRAPKGTENQVSWIVQMTRDLELVQKVVKSHDNIELNKFYFSTIFYFSNNFRSSISLFLKNYSF